jgi:glycosyltransferase involved in cell wall biosynthesis
MESDWMKAMWEAGIKVSIITAVYNNARHLAGCIKSVSKQDYPDIEHIVVDGASTDGTLDVIRENEDTISCWVSAPDDGIYSALNKGIELATGDVVGLLHSDDIFFNETVISDVVKGFMDTGAESLYGDLYYVSKDNTERVVRYWKSSAYRPGLFCMGWMPPHTTFFVRRSLYEKYGAFRTDMRISADYELMLRFIEKHGASTAYLPHVLVRMRLGGASNRSIANMIKKTREDFFAWDVNGLRRRIYTIPFKNISKLPQFLKRPSKRLI